MHPSRYGLVAALTLCLHGTPVTAAGEEYPTAPVARRLITAPGDPARPASLRVTLLTPPGPGPFPLVIWNHGSSGTPADQDMANYTNHFGTYYFLSRGYAVAQPLMRGYGGSQGQLDVTGCALDALARADARDILAVLDTLAREPDLDARRVVVAGGSFGGWNALAVGAAPDRRVRGIVNFYGGVRTSRCPAGDQALARGAAALGAGSQIPSIWFYGDNDALFPRATWQAMYQAYRAAGGRAELVAFGSFLSNAHKLLSYPESLPLFAPRLDAFLGSLGLAARVLHPEYLPRAAPAASGFARLDDVAAVPGLNEAARDAYRRFLALPYPRAFLIAPGRFVIGKSGGFDPLARGLDACAARGVPCLPYAVDGDVVWSPRASPPNAAARPRVRAAELR